MDANDAVTIGRKLSSLRAFFRLAVRRRLVRAQPGGRAARAEARQAPAGVPGQGGRRPPARRRRRRGPTPTPTQLALERALFEVIYGAGLRVSEACGLDVGDIERRRRRARCVRVRQGKGRKDRIVPIGAQGARGAGRLRCRARAARGCAGRRPPAATAPALFVSRARAAARAARRCAGCSARREQADRHARASRRTRCATASRRTCSARARTCARSRRCSATPACAPRSATRTSTSTT